MRALVPTVMFVEGVPVIATPPPCAQPHSHSSFVRCPAGIRVTRACPDTASCTRRICCGGAFD
jgi:hypothetical protein